MPLWGSSLVYSVECFYQAGHQKGWTKYIKDFSYLSGELKTGLIPPENRPALAKATTSSVVLDPLAWHFAILLTAAAPAACSISFL